MYSKIGRAKWQLKPMPENSKEKKIKFDLEET
jgi:hypothetical protein